MAKGKVEKLYWLGKGQVKVDGKLYGKDSANGRAFPTAKVDSKRLAAWKEEGLVSDKPFEEGGEAVSVEELTEKVKNLSAQIVELNSTDDKILILELEGEVEGLKADALKFYHADGKITVCDKAEEVVKLRKDAATKITELETENAALKEAAKKDDK